MNAYRQAEPLDRSIAVHDGLIDVTLRVEPGTETSIAVEVGVPSDLVRRMLGDALDGMAGQLVITRDALTRREGFEALDWDTLEVPRPGAVVLERHRIRRAPGSPFGDSETVRVELMEIEGDEDTAFHATAVLASTRRAERRPRGKAAEPLPGATPVLPGSDMVLARLFARELSRALDLPLFDYTASTPERLAPGAAETQLTERAKASDVQRPGKAPRGLLAVRPSEDAIEFDVRVVPIAVQVVLLVFFAPIFAGMAWLGTGSPIAAVAVAVLIGAVATGRRDRLRVDADEVRAEGRLAGFSTGRTTLPLADVEQVGAIQDARGHAVVFRTASQSLRFAATPEVAAWIRARTVAWLRDRG